MKNLIIIGAGGFGREVLGLARDTPAHQVDWQVKGFLDSRPGILDGFAKQPEELKGPVWYSPETREKYRRDLPILGDPLSYVPQAGDVFVTALGAPADKRKYSAAILAKGGEFVSIIHPRASVSAFVSLGRGCIVGPFASISPDVTIGDFVAINSYSGIAHDVTVGSWCEIDGHCLIAGRANIGEGVKIHPGAVITPGISIGDEAVVGAGSVVVRNIAAGTTVFGNPAKVIWRQKG